MVKTEPSGSFTTAKYNPYKKVSVWVQQQKEGTEKRINGWYNRISEIIHSEQQGENILKKFQSLRDLWDYRKDVTFM